MLTLIGMLDSPFVRRVAVAMQLYGLRYEHSFLSVFRHRDEMKKINPSLKVPALLLEDGTRLIDSSLILDYLDAQVPEEKRLLPPAGSRRWPLSSATGHALAAKEKAVQIYYEYALKPEGAAFQPWVDRCRDQLASDLDVLERDESFPSICGRELNHADIAAACCVGFIRHIEPKLPFAILEESRYPRLIALADYCETLPAFIATSFDADGYAKQ